MEFNNNTEALKDYKKAHIFLLDSLVFGLSESIRNLNHAVTPDDNTLVIRTIPQSTKATCNYSDKAPGAFWKNRIVILATDNTVSFKEQLKKYFRKKVVVALELHDGRVFIYGNTDQPLTFYYKSLNPTNPEDNFGYEIDIKGNTFSSEKETTIEDLNFNPFLSQNLATDL